MHAHVHTRMCMHTQTLTQREGRRKERRGSGIERKSEWGKEEGNLTGTDAVIPHEQHQLGLLSHSTQQKISMPYTRLYSWLLWGHQHYRNTH